MINEDGLLTGAFVSIQVGDKYLSPEYMPFAHPEHVKVLAHTKPPSFSEQAVTEYQAQQLTGDVVNSANFT